MLGEELAALKNKLMDSALVVESMIKKSIQGLIQKEKLLLTEVIEQDEQRENELELEIDETCIHLIACYQPQAKDLRSILMVFKMNNDLERVGDEAVNIAEGALNLIDLPPIAALADISKMADEVVKMLNDSLQALVNEDIRLARRVCKNDDVVDNLRDQLLLDLTTTMRANLELIAPINHLIRISRSLERIGDLSTNICEDVIYMVEGKTIRHQKS